MIFVIWFECLLFCGLGLFLWCLGWNKTEICWGLAVLVLFAWAFRGWLTWDFVLTSTHFGVICLLIS